MKNEIKGVKSQDEWCEDSNTMKYEVRKYFLSRFSCTGGVDVNLDNVNSPSLSQEDYVAESWKSL